MESLFPMTNQTKRELAIVRRAIVTGKVTDRARKLCAKLYRAFLRSKR